MAKIKMVAVLTYFYEADTQDYPDGATPEDIALIDTNSDFADIVAQNGDFTVTPA